MRKITAVAIILLFFISCGKMKGEFAFQNPGDKGYKVNQSRLEFNSKDEVNWIYKLSSAPRGRVKIGIIILKKEIGWIDVLTVSDYADPLKDTIYGKLKDMEPGEYKIVLIESNPAGNRHIDEIEIYLYSDEDNSD
jgi:hypothetical protein